MLTVYKYGAEVLRKTASAVDVFDEDLEKLIYHMFKTLRKSKGIGLAAPQVGRDIRVLVVDISKYDGTQPFAVVNPTITYSSNDMTSVSEGCLSVPDFYHPVQRFKNIVVEGFTAKGNPCKIEAKDLLSVVLQHEIDHLNGVLFIDYIDDPLIKAEIDSKFKQA